MRMRYRFLWFWAALVFFFLYFPLLMMAANSFNRSHFSNRWEGFTFQWYRALFEDQEILAAFGSSLWIAFVSTMIAAFLGTSAALALRDDPRKARSGKWTGASILEALLMVPVILPDIVMGISLLLLFVLVHLQLGWGSVILAHITFSMVYVFLVVRVRLKGLDPSLEEASADLGASGLKTFLRVTLPLILPGVIAGSLLAFTLSFEDFLITFFTAGVGVTTLPLKIYSMMKFGVSPSISALSTAFLALTIVAAFFVQFRAGDKA